MAMLLHEIWRTDGAHSGITMCLAGPMGDQPRAMLEPGSRLLQVFMAGSSFEAGTIHNHILGFGTYRSEWKELDSQPYPEEWAAIQNKTETAGRSGLR